MQNDRFILPGKIFLFPDDVFSEIGDYARTPDGKIYPAVNPNPEDYPQEVDPKLVPTGATVYDVTLFADIDEESD